MGSSPLDELIEREAFAQAIAALTPGELIVAALRLEGLSDSQIGELLGTHRTHVCRTMLRAQRRIARQVPEAAHLVSGRRRRRGRRPPPTTVPLERGWLCDWPAPGDEQAKGLEGEGF